AAQADRDADARAALSLAAGGLPRLLDPALLGAGHGEAWAPPLVHVDAPRVAGRRARGEGPRTGQVPAQAGAAADGRHARPSRRLHASLAARAAAAGPDPRAG